MTRSNIILNFLRKIHTLLFPRVELQSIHGIDDLKVDFYKQDASDLIKEYILKGVPFAVGRLGTELYTLLNYKEVNLPKLEFYYKYITKQLYYKVWDQKTIDVLCKFTGFFPPKIEEVEKFSALMIRELQNVDIWGCFSTIEKQFKEELEHTIKIQLADIDPILHRNPWTIALAGKKVLVIHPFEKSIISQYKKREYLFENKQILPKFKLRTIEAIQTIANSKTEYKDWFEALDFMKRKIDMTDFDVALIGCGAYSLPLTTYIKSIGKSAIYLGGGTQILFGIIGNRWESMPEIAKLINEYWVRPLPEETPDDSISIEGGCYW